MAKNVLPSRLLRRCRAWAGQLTKLAKANAPNHLKKYIHSKVEPNGESPTYTVRVYVNLNENPAQKGGSQDAAAWEFGSGLHARRGAKRKYPIRPKNGKYLAFKWDVADANPENFRFLPDGRVILPSVMHPGIKGKPYIQPAVTELRRRLRADLNQDIRESIRVSMADAFKGAKRK